MVVVCRGRGVSSLEGELVGERRLVVVWASWWGKCGEGVSCLGVSG